MKKLLLILIIIALIFPISMAADEEVKVKTTISELSESTIEWKQVTDRGVSEPLSAPLVKTKLSPTTMMFKASTGSKMIQVNPMSTVTISADTQTVMQTSASPESPRVELYYGYQTSQNSPWTNYYKIEKCDGVQCRVVRADFATRKVWIEYIPVATANSITGILPYESLPSGVKL